MSGFDAACKRSPGESISLHQRTKPFIGSDVGIVGMAGYKLTFDCCNCSRRLLARSCRSKCPLSKGNVLQNYFHDQNDSRKSTSAQRRFKNTVQLDSIIARSQLSKEFCNTIRGIPEIILTF